MDKELELLIENNRVFGQIAKRFLFVVLANHLDEQERLRDSLFRCGQQWGNAPTPDEIIAALDVAGFQIVPKSESA